MTRGKTNLRTEPQPVPEDSPDQPLELGRDEELCHKESIQDAMLDTFGDILKGLDSHADRADNAMDNWDMYNGVLGNRQVYNGTSQSFVPFVHDAMEARKTRFTGQLFPRSGRFVDVISEDATLPHGLMALLDWYVRKARLRTEVVPALVKAGDAEGQYSIYISWVKNKRFVVWREFREGMQPDEEIEIVKQETVTHAYPNVEVLSDADVMILPVTATSMQDALNQGGCAVVLRRWTKTKIKQMAEDDEIDGDEADDLLSAMQQDTDNPSRKDPAKQHIDAAGIKKDGRGTYALVYEIWNKLLLDSDSNEEDEDKEKRICRSYMAGGNRLLSCKRNPYWSDKLPIISVPKDKIANVVKGKPACDAVADFQYAANDFFNMGADSAQYTLCPIVMTDPEKNPVYGSMILTMAAVWKTNPQDTQFVQFPELWKNAAQLVEGCQHQIFQTLGVNPAQITQGAGTKKKMNQAEIAIEQQVDLLTTADAVMVLEEGVLSPMLERFVEMDHQFRDEDVTVPAFGEMGVEAKMEKIPPIQFGRRYQFLWYGVEAAKNAQQIQQQIAGINVLRGIPPQLYQGYKLNLVPALTNFVESAFGPRLAPLIFEDIRHQISVDPKKENQWLSQGIQVSVHAMDNHQQHMAVHAEGLQQSGGDPTGRFREHLLMHQMAMMEAQQAQQGQQPGGQPGAPGGSGPGQPGQPRPGASPGQPRGGQNPPGAVHQDQMHQPGVMPRRAG